LTPRQNPSERGELIVFVKASHLTKKNFGFDHGIDRRRFQGLKVEGMMEQCSFGGATQSSIRYYSERRIGHDYQPFLCFLFAVMLNVVAQREIKWVWT
jgi:hypothetical protein